MPASGPIGPAPSTTRGISYGRASARDRAQHLSSLFAVDGTAKKEERGIAVPNGGAPLWWLLIKSSTLSSGGNNIFDYSVDVYESALGRNLSDGSDLFSKFSGSITSKARNSCETDNTAILQAGYVINASGTGCTDIVGVYPIGKTRVPCWGFEHLPGTDPADPANARFVFSVRNDPHFYGVGT